MAHFRRSPGACALLFFSCFLLLGSPVLAQSDSLKSYRVKKGDTLSKIARRHKCSIDEIAKPNKIKAPSYVIHPGKKIKIPVKCQGSAAKKASSASKTKTRTRSCPSGSFYKVKKGDGLHHIGRMHGTTTRAFQRANNLKDINKLFVGQRLCIPGKDHSGICNWSSKSVRSKSLQPLMKNAGFKHRGEKRFRAMVVELTLDGSTQNAKVIKQEVYDYNGKSDAARGWNPASTVKIYSALAAVTRARRNGIGWNTPITFHDKRTEKTTLKKLVHDALSLSNNLAHNRLAQFAGFNFMHLGKGSGDRGFFKNNGLRNTYLMRAYQQTKWRKVAHSKSFRNSPKITFGKRSFPGGTSKGKVKCYGAACTSLGDLSRAMCRFMLHEQLDITGDVFDFSDDFTSKGSIKPNSFLYILRKSLQGLDTRGKQTQRRGRNVINNLVKGFREGKRGFGKNTKFYHKPGFARDWFSDVVYVYKPGNKRWIVAMAGYPGRHSLDKASKIVGKIIAQGKL
jgi:LysM repeat protein